MDQVFLMINSWMGQGLLLGGLGCFFWGVVSVVFSPCHLASIPLLVGYVAGQDSKVCGYRALVYSLLFTCGLFATIAALGIICSVLGRMLGDVGVYMDVVVGAILVWVALDILGIIQCAVPNSLMSKVQLRGLAGAFVLGLTYGILSGSCTFGFIAPILAIITVQDQVMTGLAYIVLFGIGHCLPIALAGTSTAMVKNILENSSWQKATVIIRKLAGVLIGGLGLYFISEALLKAAQ